MSELTPEQLGIWRFSARALQAEVVKEGLVSDKLTRICSLQDEPWLITTAGVLFKRELPSRSQ